MDDDHWYHLLGITFLRTYWLFQALVAGPISAGLAISAFVRLFNMHGPIYDFVTHLCTAALCAAIVFIVLVQRKLPEERTSKDLTLKFEIAKSSLGTALWIWLMLDAAFGPQNQNVYYKRSTRTGSAAIAFIVLLILFYPTVFYAARDRRRSAAIDGESSPPEEVVERTPLLQS